MFSLGGSSKPSPSNSANRLLFVEVVEARGIIAVNKNNTSDPYVVVSLQDLGGRHIKSETFNTKQKNATITPSWGESFTFGTIPILFVLFIIIYLNNFPIQDQIIPWIVRPICQPSLLPSITKRLSQSLKLLLELPLCR